MSSCRKPTVLCLACGEVTSRPSDRRNLSSASSQHVVPLWKEIAAEECQRQNMTADLDSVTSGHSGYVPEMLLCI